MDVGDAPKLEIKMAACSEPYSFANTHGQMDSMFKYIYQYYLFVSGFIQKISKETSQVLHLIILMVPILLHSNILHEGHTGISSSEARSVCIILIFTSK